MSYMVPLVPRRGHLLLPYLSQRNLGVANSHLQTSRAVRVRFKTSEKFFEADLEILFRCNIQLLVAAISDVTAVQAY